MSGTMKPRIRGIAGPEEGKEYPLGKTPLKIGRGTRNQIDLNDPLVSTKHCSILYEEDRCILLDLGSEHGTFVNGFLFPATLVYHGDHIRIGRSIFVYLLHVDVDDSLLKLSPVERHWCYGNYTPDHAGAYEAAKGVTLSAVLRLQASVSALRTPEEILGRALDFIFEVIPVDRAAILLAGHDQDRFVSSSFRSGGPPNGNAFPIDEAITLKVLQDGALNYADKAVCFPMTAFETKVGVIFAGMSKPGAEWFTAGHMEVLESLASSTAVALEHLRYVTWLEGENRRLTELLHAEHGMIGRSEAMKEVYTFIARSGPGERTVLITGASGTGKELVAYAIHRNSPRSNKRFMAVNCGAFSESLLQSELFGYERGAFTGAVAARKGLFEEADGCTVFLDEIGELPLNMQADLLRVLQEGEVKRLGSHTVVKVNVRIVAATNRDLREEVKKGRFRQDLFYRLNVLPLQMPSLAERRDDIPDLAAHFIRKYRHIRCAPYPEVLGITPEAHKLLTAYTWPGNVRELENAVEWAISMGTTPYLQPDDLPKEVRSRSDSAEVSGTLYDREIAAFQKSLFERIIRETAGNRAEAARRLGWHPTSFRRRCSELGIIC